MKEFIINYIFEVGNHKDILKYIFVVDQNKEPHFTIDSFCEMLQVENISVHYPEKANESIGKHIIIGNEKREVYLFLIQKPNSPLYSIQSKMKKVIENNKDKFEVINMLWNDECFELSNKAYPCIYTIENNMRELITRFMLDNFGSSWETKYLPEKELKKNSLAYKIYEKNQKKG